MRIAKLAAAAAVLSLAASAAQAAVTITFTGTVKSGVDGAGLFGAVGADLTGLAFTSAYVVDDTLIHIGPNDTGSAEGGGAYGTPLPVISASMTINGLTYNPTASYYGLYIEENGYGTYTHVYYQKLLVRLFDFSPGDQLSNSCSDRTSAPAPMACKNDWEGYFTFSGAATTGFLTTTGASSSDPLPLRTSYVPEPMTWALMIAGFGMVGASLRRRRRITV